MPPQIGAEHPPAGPAESLGNVTVASAVLGCAMQQDERAVRAAGWFMFPDEQFDPTRDWNQMFAILHDTSPRTNEEALPLEPDA